MTIEDKFIEPRFSYKAVEAALAVTLDIDPAWRTMLVARLKHFQRLGATETHLGKGSRILYSFELAAKLAILLMLADAGLSPALSVQSVGEHWEQDLRRRCRQAVAPETQDGENPWFLILRLEAMRGPWAKQSAIAAIGAFQRNQPEKLMRWIDHPEGRNFCVFALSRVLHRLCDEMIVDGPATDGGIK